MTRLTLAALESHDPNAPGGGRRRRFRCPLPGCADGDHARNLSVDVREGWWHCFRCGDRGRLVEYLPERSARGVLLSAPPAPLPPDAQITAAWDVVDALRLEDRHDEAERIARRLGHASVLLDRIDAAEDTLWWLT